MCGSNNASKRAAEEAKFDEQLRQSKMEEATQVVNAIFNGGNAFSGDSYLKANPDVAADEIFAKNPFLHWQQYGQNEGRGGAMVSFGSPGGRDRSYSSYANAMYQTNARDIERQRQEAQRSNKFGLARTGLMGGSVDVDSKADIDRRANEGLMFAKAAASQAAGNLRNADNGVRSQLISMAQSGADAGSLAQMAMQATKAAGEMGAGMSNAYLMSGLFDDLANTYTYNQQMAGRRMASANEGNQWYGVSSPHKSYAGS